MTLNDQPAPRDDEAAMRKAFEEWYGEYGPNTLRALQRRGSDYYFVQTNTSWLAWCAAWNRRAPVVVTDEIAAERQRQISAEGWSPLHDDKHDRGELALAAACYCASSAGKQIERNPWWSVWPWELSWWKPKDRRRDLIRAASLIVAEIERLDRRALTAALTPDDGAGT